MTRAVVEAVADSSVAVADTRKTTPGLGMFEKYAVRMGGGANHRFGLDDAVMLKDNHIAAAGSITKAVAKARARVGHTVKIEVEVDTLDQLAALLEDPVDIVLARQHGYSDAHRSRCDDRWQDGRRSFRWDHVGHRPGDRSDRSGRSFPGMVDAFGVNARRGTGYRLAAD